MPPVPVKLAQVTADGGTWRLLGMPDGRVVLLVDGPTRWGEIEMPMDRAGPLGRALVVAERQELEPAAISGLPADVAGVVGRALISLAARTAG